MTDDEIKAHIGQVKAEAEALTLREANRARNQAVGVFGFVVVLLTIIGYFGLDAVVTQQVTDALKYDAVTKARLHAEAARDAARLAADLAENGRDRAAAAAASAEALALLPVGSIIACWDFRAELPEGWAICNGDYPEPGWPEKTPNLVGKVLVGARGGADAGIKEGVKIRIPEPERNLEAGFDMAMNTALRAAGKEEIGPEQGLEENFFERVESVLKAKPDHEVEIRCDHLPRAQVHFIIRYK